MTTTKLRIDISQGIIEVEGNETFVLSIYNDYKEKITKLNSPKNNSNTIDEPVIKAATKKQNAKSESSKPKRKGTSQVLSLVKDLDLSGKISGESLKSFYNNYNVKSNFDKNLIFIYYMEQSLKLTPINMNHVYTCYKEVGSKIPEAFKQSLLDTSSNKGWIETADTNNLSTTTRGINLIEHSLPKKEDAK